MRRMAKGGILAAFLIIALATLAGAEPTFWTSRGCSGCHTDDTATCNGCHMHDGNLAAHAGAASYGPGDPVIVTLTGGSQHGWIRGILYDQNGTEIYRATGPTGTGDDGQGNQVTFPVAMQGTAPAIPGSYVWEAAWFGNNNGSGHYELRRPVTILVEDINTGIPVSPVDSRSWAQIKALY